MKGEVAGRSGGAPAAVVRGLAVAAGASLLVLWGRFAWVVSRGGAGEPGAAAGAPGAAVRLTETGLGAGGPPLWVAVGIFGFLALAGALAALRDAPVVVLLAGGISFVPVGAFLLAVPGPPRWIGVLDLVMAGSGIVLLVAALRGEGPSERAS